jgi:hypothetical protein
MGFIEFYRDLVGKDMYVYIYVYVYMYICTFEHRELHQPSHRVRPNIYRDIEPTIWNLGCSRKMTFRLMAILLRHGFGGLI